MSQYTTAFGLGMAGLLAWRNLAHDRSRFFVTMIGIIFAVILIAMELGLFFGFTESTTSVIQHTHADIWIVAKGTRNFEVAPPIQDRELYFARSVSGVAHAEGLIIQFAPWKKPLGGEESVQILGFDLNYGLARPWNLVAGELESLRQADSVMIDRLFTDKLGVNEVGQEVEINQHRARVVGFTQGIRSFTTFPWVFTSARTAQSIIDFAPHQWNYILVTLLPGADTESVCAALRILLPRADVYTAQGLADMTHHYWMFTTGAGASVLLSAMLGVIVGVVIVAQVLYATTVDHLTEFGTLRAMGAPRGFIYRIIFGQALISAVIGHAVGISVAMLLAQASLKSAVLVLVSPKLAAALFLLTLTMCLLAAVVSIRKAMTIDPAMVFQR
ncbi:ABC transporter permease [Rhodopseudomonas palustris]|uniref:ABC transporter permease n=1 Tax=Thiospirillum jenense TaxID=1653858 RepID=A0A839H5D2_9GAMM|nr:ABC transporter permease [Thiospirillum jenense]MBB1089704.1 ABC transporter permease [Rhodopseudomonas palustris]MBB1124804.1 ABC transporter permease [Thiospirillum jenense]